MQRKKYVISILLLITTLSCEKFKYNHYQVTKPEKDTKLNSENIAKFINIKKDTIQIAVIGDSQRFYTSTNKIVKKINTIPDIDFVVHTGDLSDFGTEEEFVLMHEQLSLLKYPYVAVIGNHDLIGGGGDIYSNFYGEYNFSFTFNGNKFIYINTNASEFDYSNNVPDINWLDKQLSDTLNYDNAIIVCHVPHWSIDFNAKLTENYLNTLKKYNKVLLSINGHDHNFSYQPFKIENISILNSYSTHKEKFVLAKIWNKGHSIEVITL